MSYRPQLFDLIIAAVVAASPACRQPADRPQARDSSGSDDAKEATDAAGAQGALPVPALPPITTWELDPENSSVTFVVKHAMHTNVRGMFQRPAGSVVLDEAAPASSKVDATVDVTTVMTGVEERDTHLKGPEFFDAAKYPTITFASTAVTRASDTSYAVTGDLTMHGVTKPVTLAVTVSPPFQHFGTVRRGIAATTSVNRMDFGVGIAAWNGPAESGGLLIGDRVALTIDAELVLRTGE